MKKTKSASPTKQGKASTKVRKLSANDVKTALSKGGSNAGAANGFKSA